MFNKKRNSGFTLTEVLISAGILSIGFMMIAGAFPVGVKLTQMATERTIGSTTSQESVAKMKIHGIGMSDWNAYENNVSGLTYGRCFDYSDIARLDWANTITPGFFPELPTEDDYYYPSTNLASEKKYHWSALCRRLSIDEVQVTVFVSRLGGFGVTYPANPIPTGGLDPALPNPAEIDYPEPYMVQNVTYDPLYPDSLTIPAVDPSGAAADYRTYFREGTMIVDDLSGQIFTIMEGPSGGAEIKLDRNWPNAIGGLYNVWVIPSAIKPGSTSMPAVLGGRWPCVWVSQEIVKFQNFSSVIAVP